MCLSSSSYSKSYFIIFHYNSHSVDFEIFLSLFPHYERTPSKYGTYLKNTHKFQDCYQIYDWFRPYYDKLSYLIILKNALIRSFKIAITFMIFHALFWQLNFITHFSMVGSSTNFLASSPIKLKKIALSQDNIICKKNFLELSQIFFKSSQTESTFF